MSIEGSLAVEPESEEFGVGGGTAGDSSKSPCLRTEIGEGGEFFFNRSQ